MSQKIYLTILKSGIYASFISVFLVFKNLLFPFITSKQISFNILIEVLFVIWFAFIIKYPEYRPKKSWISFGLIGFFAAMLLSCFTTVDFNLSFWGDIERMLGIFHLLHFLAFYFIVITVFRKWEDWRNLFIVSITAAVVVCLYGQIKSMHYSTIGNTAYVSGYVIFNIFFALILLFRTFRDKFSFKNQKSLIIGSCYLIAIFIMLSIFKMTNTRGAYVGLGAGIMAGLLLFIVLPRPNPLLSKERELSRTKRVRFYSSLAAVIFAVLVSLVFAYPQSRIVKNSAILRTVTQISSQAVTFQTRIISWKAAAKDFPNHPILGTGHGNYAITFDKYFDPSFYDYTRAETYFDRAHNNIVDIASTTGIVGLAAYLSIFIAALYYLISGYRRKQIGANEFILLIGLMIAYFIQNLAVFDSLVTYISLMIMLGYIYYLTPSPSTPPPPAPSPKQEKGSHNLPSYLGGDGGGINVEDKPLINKEIYALAGAGLIIFIIMFQFNIKPLKMLAGTIQGQIAFARQDFIGGIEAYKKALSYNTVLDRDSRDSLIRVVAANFSALSGIDAQQAGEILDYVVGLAEENVKYNPRDSLMQMELAQILNLTARFYSDNSQKFFFYSDRSLEAINKSIESSPGRVPIYFIKAQIQATRNEQEEAIETLKYAAGLNEKYYDSYCNLARYYFVFKQEDNGYKTMDQCLDKGGSGLLTPADYVKGLINHYTELQDWDRSLMLYRQLSVLEASDPKVWVNLAKLYAQTGDVENAKLAAEKAAELDHSLIQAVEEFIRGLE
ncbi:O-antigen ligase family protein [Patescibacteria group bacterium]|nr:O-antigen ligase family protein [Patescibacteria group bacterium]MBU4600555.1 O-antigen ligase family protein [Patescibacteria group bacterium]MCG2697657.1 O-antigen ligase family protein [Candidatus Parcubacteria bacterium]